MKPCSLYHMVVTRVCTSIIGSIHQHIQDVTIKAKNEHISFRDGSALIKDPVWVVTKLNVERLIHTVVNSRH